MKRFFVIVTISLFMSAMCAPAITVSAQEPQKKEAVKKQKSTCDKPCTKEAKEACSAADKKEAEKKETEKKEVKQVEKKKKK